MSTSPWLPYRSNPDGSPTLICFHHAAGAASAFQALARELPAVDVAAVQLPGREQRVGESPVSTPTVLLAQLEEALVSLTERPYAILGHSLGARIATAFAARMEERGRPPLTLIVSCGKPPQTPSHGFERLSDDEFVRRLAELSPGIRPALDEPALVELLLPCWRADFELAEAFDCILTTAQVACPLYVFMAMADSWVDPELAGGWRTVAKGSMSHRRFLGGHFYLQEQPEEFAAAVAEALELRT